MEHGCESSPVRYTADASLALRMRSVRPLARVPVWSDKIVRFANAYLSTGRNDSLNHPVNELLEICTCRKPNLR